MSLSMQSNHAVHSPGVVASTQSEEEGEKKWFLKPEKRMSCREEFLNRRLDLQLKNEVCLQGIVGRESGEILTQYIILFLLLTSC